MMVKQIVILKSLLNNQVIQGFIVYFMVVCLIGCTFKLIAMYNNLVAFVSSLTLSWIMLKNGLTLL